MSFQDPHISFYLAQRQILAPEDPSPIGVFSLQGKRWRVVQEESVLEALVEAEAARLRELGMSDVLVTRYYFQDAHFLRELVLPADRPDGGYCSLRRTWFSELGSTYLTRPPEERFVRSSEFNAVLQNVQHIMERNLRRIDPRKDETIKVELYARDPGERALFLVASSESVLLDPTRSRRYPLTLDDDRATAAVKAFTRGTPGLFEKAGPHGHGRWNGFWAVPIMLGSAPWYGFPVGALVVCTTHDLESTSLRLTIPSVEPELHAALQQCARLLDPRQPVGSDITDVLIEKIVEKKHELVDTE
jgi:hypothetical protein